mgnify:CR=1 FL=1
MRLYPGRLPELAKDTLRSLTKDGAIELIEDHVQEAELDIESVLREYHRQEREVHDHAKDVLAARGMDFSNLRRVKMQLASQRGMKLGDDGYEYLMDQIIEMIYHSKNVDEIFCDNSDLRRRMLPVLRKYTAQEEKIEQQAKARLKNLDEGTVTWDLEITRQIDQIRRERNG